MAKLSAISVDHTLGEEGVFHYKGTLKLSDGVKATLGLRSGSNALAATLAGKQWEVQHDFAKKDTHLKLKRKVGGATVTLKQHVPGGKWAVVPNPVVELSKSGVIGTHGKLEAAYDCLNRVGKLEQTVYGGGDKEHKAQLKLSTAAGPSASVRSKLKAGPLLHSASASFSAKGGAQLSAKSKFGDGTKVKTSYSLKSEIVSVTAKHTPKKLSPDDAKATLTLSVDCHARGAAQPKVKFGVKFDL